MLPMRVAVTCCGNYLDLYKEGMVIWFNKQLNKASPNIEISNDGAMMLFLMLLLRMIKKLMLMMLILMLLLLIMI
jgi:hypothetical protein